MNQQIINQLKNAVSAFDPVSEAYLFGSSIHSDTSNDLDLLLVYEGTSIADAIHAKNILVTLLQSSLETKRFIDVTLFSRSELKQTNFLSITNHDRIK